MDGTRKTKKREQLMQSAEQLILQKGIRQLTVEEIINHAKVSKATFYKYFNDKRDIVEQVIYKLSNLKSELLSEMIEKGKRERITRQDLIHFFDLNKYDRFLQSDFMLEFMQDYPEVTAKLVETNTAVIMPLFHEFIRMAKIDGVVRMEVDTEVLMIYTHFLGNALREYHKLNMPMPKQMSLKEFYERFFDLYLNGVLIQESPNS
ncbi:TetR/AcrR family transcriptional regulator [Paenibacillus tarimensis]